MPEHAGEPEPEDAERPCLASQLDRLFDDVRPHGPHGRPYTNQEVALAVKRASPGTRVSGAYLSALRRGSKRNPSTELLSALARFFGVPASYFLDPGSSLRADAEIELAKVACNLGVRKLALRALELSPEGLAAITQIVEHVLEGDTRAQPPQPGPTPGPGIGPGVGPTAGSAVGPMPEPAGES